MSDSKSSTLFLNSTEAGRKFDYFITGLIAAYLAYMVKGMKPTVLGLNQFTFELVAIVALFISLIFSLKRLEAHQVLIGLNAKMLQYAEEAGQHMKAIQSGSDGYNNLTGQVITVEGSKKQRLKCIAWSKEAEKQYGIESERVVSLYNYRSKFLFVSIVVMLLAKVVPPYLT